MPLDPTAPDPTRPSIHRRLPRLLLAAGGGFLAFVFFSQRSMIYFPSREDSAALERTAAAQGFQPWRDPQGHTIGYRDPADPADSRPPLAVLLFHGNAGHALHRAAYSSILRDAAPDRAVSIHILEYPGYGARPGKPTQASLLAAANDALALIPSNSPVLLLGESLGTGVACATAAENPRRVAGLLLVTPFDSLANVARHHYPLLPVGWILRDTYPSAEWLPAYPGPAAFLLAKNDTIVPARLGHALHALHPGPKFLLEDPLADHNDLISALPPAAWQKTLAFLLTPPSERGQSKILDSLPPPPPL
jgi:uncharacterized protein